jgi:hypothetical protein
MILRTKLLNNFEELKANPSRPVTDKAAVMRLIELLDQRGPEDGRLLADVVELKDFCLPVECRFMLRDPLLPNGGTFNSDLHKVDLPKFTDEANLWEWILAEAVRYREHRLLNSAFDRVPLEHFPIRAYGIWIHELHGKLVIEHTEIVKARNWRTLDAGIWLVLNPQGFNEIYSEKYGAAWLERALEPAENFPALIVVNDHSGLEFLPNNVLKGLKF